MKTGIYGIVRHPMYGRVIYLALAYTSWQMSWVHLVGSIVLFVFLDIQNWRLGRLPVVGLSGTRTSIRWRSLSAQADAVPNGRLSPTRWQRLRFALTERESRMSKCVNCSVY